MKMIGSSSENNRKVSYYKFGKEQYKKFGNYNVKKTTFLKTTIQGILMTLICILPFLLIMIQFFSVYFYNPGVKLFLIVLAWAMLLICNGLSNYFTVIFTKNLISDDIKLQEIDEKAILFYTTFSIGYIIFTLFLMAFIVIGVT